MLKFITNLFAGKPKDPAPTAPTPYKVETPAAVKPVNPNSATAVVPSQTAKKSLRLRRPLLSHASQKHQRLNEIVSSCPGQLSQ